LEYGAPLLLEYIAISTESMLQLPMPPMPWLPKMRRFRPWKQVQHSTTQHTTEHRHHPTTQEPTHM
jgi:hypothetical protein